MSSKNLEKFNANIKVDFRIRRDCTILLNKRWIYHSGRTVPAVLMELSRLDLEVRVDSVKRDQIVFEIKVIRNSGGGFSWSQIINVHILGGKPGIPRYFLKFYTSRTPVPAHRHHIHTHTTNSCILKAHSHSHLSGIPVRSTEVGLKCEFEWRESGLLYSLSEHSHSKNVGWFVFIKRTQLPLTGVALVINEYGGKTYILTHYTDNTDVPDVPTQAVFFRIG